MAHDWKGFIIGSIISAIRFLIIYSLWFNPAIITSTYNRIKSSVGTNIKSQVEQDPSVSSCLNQINKKLEIQKEKSVIKTNIYIKEYKKFSTKNEAENYLKEWGFSNYSLYHEGLNYRGPVDWMDYAQKDIIIALVKQEWSAEGQIISQLSPYLCVDGNFKIETRCPEGAMTGINIQRYGNGQLSGSGGAIFTNPEDKTFELAYNINSTKGDIYNYSLVLKDSTGEVVSQSSWNNPNGGRVVVSEDYTNLGSNFNTEFIFSTPCGTYKE